MTKFTVVWHPAALDQLADLWVKHPDLREQISAASRHVDRHLAWDAHLKAEDLPGGLKGAEISPLVIVFTVSEPDRLVDVGEIRLAHDS